MWGFVIEKRRLTYLALARGDEKKGEALSLIRHGCLQYIIAGPPVNGRICKLPMLDVQHRIGRSLVYKVGICCVGFILAQQVGPRGFVRHPRTPNFSLNYNWDTHRAD